ncbi:MAG: AcrR family transcriptional regulator [Myxococcota bacterium]|jgi:AcrR family transcriptional regulator
MSDQSAGPISASASRSADSAARRRARDPQVVRRRLLTAATSRFAELGFDGVNSNQIARDAGVGVGTFYHHFKDKFEAHQAVVLDTLDELQGAVARAAIGPRAPVESQVRDLVQAVVRYAEANPAKFRVAFGQEITAMRAPRGADGKALPRGSSRAQVGYSTRATERRLSQLQMDGALDPALDPTVAARAFVAMQNSVICWWLEDPTRAGREALIRTLIKLHPAVAAAI